MVIKDCCHKYYFLKLCVFNFYQANMKKGFASGTWNKVVQNPNNKIVKNKFHFEIDIKLFKNILMKKL